MDNYSKNISSWIGMLVFIQLTIVTPFFDHIENRHIGEAQKQIETLIKAKASELDLTKDAALKISLREQLYKLNMDHVELEGKRDKRVFKIPVGGIEIDEKAFAILYPMIILCGLGYILWSRTRWLKTGLAEGQTIPFWAYPTHIGLPKGEGISNTKITFVKNSIAIFAHTVPVIWLANFIAKQYSRNGMRIEYIIIISTLAIILLGFYISALVNSITEKHYLKND